MVKWLYGYVVMWQYGYMALWHYGYMVIMAIQLYGYIQGFVVHGGDGYSGGGDYGQYNGGVDGGQYKK